MWNRETRKFKMLLCHDRGLFVCFLTHYDRQDGEVSDACCDLMEDI